MNRRTFLKAASVGLAAGPITPVLGYALQPSAQDPSTGNGIGAQNQLHRESPEQILLKDYRPKSIYKIPVTEIAKAEFRSLICIRIPTPKPRSKLPNGSQHGPGWSGKDESFSLRPSAAILTRSTASTPNIQTVSKCGAVLTMRAMTGRDSVRLPSGNSQDVIKPVRVASVSCTTRGRAWQRQVKDVWHAS